MWYDPKRLTVQMFYEFGIFSTYCLGNEVPYWLRGDKSIGSSISFIMPLTPMKKRFQGFNIASVHAFISKGKACSFSTKIINQTKNLSWIYTSVFCVVGEGDEEIVWLSHWMFGNNEFEDGDEVCLYIRGNEAGVVVNECGISPVYGVRSDMDDDEEEEDPLAYYKSWKYIIGGDLSQFQLDDGHFLLFHCRLLYA